MIYLDHNATTPVHPRVLEVMLPYLSERFGSRAPPVPNTSNLTFDSVDGESIVLGLDLHGICVSTGSACSTGDPEPSHVLLAMGLPARDAQGSIRISLGRSTVEADVEATAKALQLTVERLRTISSVGGTTGDS